MENNELKIENLSFEEALDELENIVRELESGRIKLDDAVKAYEKAVKLKQYCSKKLNEATLKVEKIEIDKNGNIKSVPLDEVQD